MERPSPGTIGRKVRAVLEQPQTVSGPVHPTATMGYTGSRCQGGDLSTAVQTKAVTVKLLFTYDRFIIFERGYAHFFIRLFHPSAF